LFVAALDGNRAAVVEADPAPNIEVTGKGFS
jgi:hypothetical protein